MAQAGVFVDIHSLTTVQYSCTTAILTFKHSARLVSGVRRHEWNVKTSSPLREILWILGGSLRICVVLIGQLAINTNSTTYSVSRCNVGNVENITMELFADLLNSDNLRCTEIAHVKMSNDRAIESSYPHFLSTSCNRETQVTLLCSCLSLSLSLTLVLN